MITRTKFIVMTLALLFVCGLMIANGQTTSSNLEQNKGLMRRLYSEIFNQGRLEVANEIIAPNLIQHNPTAKSGSEGFKAAITGLRTAFPDWNSSIEDIAAEGDRVWVRHLVTATHKGEFAGIAASGRGIKLEVVDIYRVENGKLAEHWDVYDAGGLIRQISAK